MKIHSITLAVLVALAGGALAPTSLHAEPLKPTLSEVNGVVDVLRFRSDMIADPDKAIRNFSADASARRQLNTIADHMEEAGSGKAGWRYLLGTSVFSVAGLNAPRTLVVFYNPWVDTAMFTIWEAEGDERKIVESEWVPGDLVRQEKAEIDPQPLWLRGQTYRPQALADAVVTTVGAIETRFGEAQIDDWKEILGVKDARAYNRYIAPIVAVRLYETQMRLKALAVATKGEDPLIEPLRTAVADLMKAVRTEGFAGPLEQARDTSAPMREALSRINPWTMQGLAPVAFVAGDGHATVFLASTVTADFALSARYSERDSSYALQQLEYIPYAATYQASLAEGANK